MGLLYRASPPENRYVGVIVPTGFHEVVEGVARFAFPAHPWRVKWFSGWGGTDIPSDVNSDHFDGLIVLEDRPGMLAALDRPGRSVVVVTSENPPAKFPRVIFDHQAIGRMAAEELLNRGFTNFAYCSKIAGDAAMERGRYFAEHLAAAGQTCSFWQNFGQDEAAIVDSLGAWLKALPRPLAVFCECDWHAKITCDVCHIIGLRVPEDVAILGAGNDELLCQLTYPPISAVEVPAQELGYKAAEMLNLLMKGETLPSQVVRLQPLGVVTRASTDTLAIKDPEVASALRFMRENIHKGISVEDVIRHLPVARRTLEKKFRQLLQRSPLEEIRRLRMERAKSCLARSDLRIPEVARSCGFEDPRRFSTVFHEQVGCSPVAFRRQCRGSMS